MRYRPHCLAQVAGFLLALGVAAVPAHADGVSNPSLTFNGPVTAGHLATIVDRTHLQDGGPVGAVLQGYISGLTLSNDGGTPNTVLDIAAGMAADSTAATMMSLGAFTKSTAGAWAAGSGSNGMGNGLTVANSTWYHVCLANNSGTPDIYFDTQVNCANRPAGISDAKYRRIGSFKTNGSAQIIAFSQNGNEFLWATPVADVSAGTLAATTSSLLSLGNIPSGASLRINGLFELAGAISTAAAASRIILSSPDVTDNAAGTGNFTIAFGSVAGFLTGSGQVNVRAVNDQIRIRTDNFTNMTYYLNTYGWIDTRGQ